MKKIFLHNILIITCLMLVFGCSRGRHSDKPPLHLNPNMDNQEKYKAQSENPIFSDGSSMRLPVDGTVASGKLNENSEFYLGVQANGKYVAGLSVPMTAALLKRGQERYRIYCSPCHGAIGNGQGIVTKYEYPIPPTSFHDDRLRTMSGGEIFNAISNGVRNMPAYKHQVKVPDRWAIVAYVRALQRSQNAGKKDVPAEILSELNK